MTFFLTSASCNLFKWSILIWLNSSSQPGYVHLVLSEFTNSISMLRLFLACAFNLVLLVYVIPQIWHLNPDAFSGFVQRQLSFKKKFSSVYYIVKKT